MAFKAKLPLLLFFFGSFLLSFTSTLAYERDPEQQLQQCTSLCERQQKFREEQCKQRCVEQYREQKREEEQRGEGDSDRDDVFDTDPQREYQQCKRRCQRQEGGSQQQQCQQRCEREEERGGGNNADPQREYKQCQRRCQEQERGSQQQCQQRCEERLREQKREERRGGGNNADPCPQREYQQCQRRCQEQEKGSQQQRQCQKRCEEKLREREEGLYQECESSCHAEERELGPRQQCHEECEEISRQQGRKNPYFFEEPSFIERYRTEEGRIRVLPKFTQRSNLHRGIENYRLAIFEANPNTFVIPIHWDADAVIYVVKGRATISMIRKENRDSFNLERGDVIRVPSGSVVYMVNRDNNEQLQIAKLYQTVSTPGHVQEFFGVGAEESDSFYRTFSNEILEAAFDTPIDQLERLFGQQRKGVIIRASKEQVQALSKQASSSSEGSHLWPGGGGSSESRGPYNILNKKPLYSNNHGELYEAKPNDYKQLQDLYLDLAVSFANITKGAMMAPYYNTRATKLILVVEGRGRFEMACPHLARQSQQESQRRGEREQEQEEEEQGGAHYQRVSARLSPNTMFIVPTGHPVAIIASDNENLQLVAFTINAQHSKRIFLAGRKDNVVKQMEKEAMELGFNIPSREVQEIYSRQTESYFVPGPNQRQYQRERGGSHGLSILDLVNF